MPLGISAGSGGPAAAVWPMPKVQVPVESRYGAGTTPSCPVRASRPRSVICMGLLQKRKDQDQGRNGQTDTQPVCEAPAGVDRIAAERTCEANEVIHRLRRPWRGADGREASR